MFSSCNITSHAFANQRVPLRWYPPEYFKNNFYSFKGDVWAFGIVLWEMQTFGELVASVLKRLHIWRFLWNEKKKKKKKRLVSTVLPIIGDIVVLFYVKMILLLGTLPYPNLETSEAVVYHICIGHKNTNPEGCRQEMWGNDKKNQKQKKQNTLLSAMHQPM